MSRNSKGAKRNAAAKEASRVRLAGGSGARSTSPQHGKKNAWWQKGGSYADFAKGGGKKRRDRSAEVGVVEVAI